MKAEEEAAVLAEESSPVSAEEIRARGERIDFADPALTVGYGAASMQGIATFADQILQQVRLKDAGNVGTQLTELLGRLQSVDTRRLNATPAGGWRRLPWVGRLFDRARATVAQFDNVASEVAKISARLEDAQLGLLRNIEILEQLYATNSKFYRELSADIAAGEARLTEARASELPALEAAAAASQDNLDAQKVRDLAESLNRFERRLHDLKLSRTVTLQTAPQIRMIQNNDRILAEKIQTSILATIPVWKNQLVLAMSIRDQQHAAALQQAVSDTTNELLNQNAQMLQDATLAAARESERGMVDTATLQEVQRRLLATIEETLAIASDGRAKRRAAAQELADMERQLRERLVDLADRARTTEVTAARGAAMPPGDVRHDPAQPRPR